ncbi:hypothetical protein [Kitasatospora sp. NPDC057015]|uniref:Tc toxin subunit A-related protein n=1 Tax=Kitasatospora sp. NPDC057015 TaxID=3346001 RepID=UPI00362C10D7
MESDTNSSREEQTANLAGATTPFAPAPSSPGAPLEVLRPGAATPHFMPRDPSIEVVLDRSEKLLSRGRYDAALREIGQVSPGRDVLGSAYALKLAEQTVRAHLGRGDRHLQRGEAREATAAYETALSSSTEHPAVTGVYALAIRAIGALAQERSALISQLLGLVARNDYTRWCETRNGIIGTSILNVPIKPLIPDIPFEDVFGTLRPGQFPPPPAEGWSRPLSDQTDPFGRVMVDGPSLTPALAFEAATTRPLTVAELAAHLGPATTTGRTHQFTSSAASSVPLLSSLIRVRARLHGLANGLDLLGSARASTPLLRYSYLRQEASRILDHVDTLDQHMITAQFKQDDFEAVLGPQRAHVDSLAAELQAISIKIDQLSSGLASFQQGEMQLRNAVKQLSQAEDDCDPEWWEVVLSVLVVIGAVAVGAVGGFILSGGNPLGAVAGAVTALIISIGLTVKVWSDKKITCENVSHAKNDFQQAHQAIQAAIGDVQAELENALLMRDALATDLVSAKQRLDKAEAGDKARVLDAATLGRVIFGLDQVRTSMILRAHTIATMAQASYNFENDTAVALIRDSHTDYIEPETRGYTAAAALRRDLDGIDYIRQTARTRKEIQLTQVVSLRKHQPMTFAALLMSGAAQFSTRLEDFDRWYPGTYLQRLREVRVEVVLAPGADSGQIRGYLTNAGVSYVRFSDIGNKTAIDNRDIFAETDPDLVKLCYKRRRRHHAVETKAFPQMSSPLADARDIALQTEERNHFENCGLETTWSLELLPDQQLNLAQIEDVRLHFQYGAYFDPSLKRVTEAKRYLDRHETALVSARQLFGNLGRQLDLTAPVEMSVSAYQFEAPQVPKTIDKVAVMVRPKGSPLLAGKAGLRISFEQSTPVEMETNEMGLIATSSTRPAGTGTDELQTLVAGKSVTGLWTVEVTSLPDGLTVADIDDLLLIVNYTYQPEA